MEKAFDLIVLGAGSGGLAAAKRASSFGARVAIVEGDRVGGTCVIRGCVPKKLLVYGSNFYSNLQISNKYGVCFDEVFINTNILLTNIRKEVDRLNELHINLLKKSGVQLINGWASFSGPNSVIVSESKNGKAIHNISGNKILIAVGGQPLIPNIDGKNLGWVSDDMFSLSSYPEKIVIVGSGYIACEFSCILNRLGIQVIHLVRGDRLLRNFDRDMSLSLQEDMQENGIELRFSESVTKISGNIGKLKVSTNKSDCIACNGLLWAIGRKPSLKALKIENAGIELTNGKLIVDKDQRTNISNIFALGDVTNSYNLTPVAIDEGRAFADKFYGNNKRCIDYELIPSAVFTQPEIGSVGLSEESAIRKFGKENIKIYRSRFRPMSQSLIGRNHACILKLVVHSSDEKILGCHMIGEHSAEIIQMGSIAIGMEARKSDFDNTMALHPTIAEEFVTMQ